MDVYRCGFADSDSLTLATHHVATAESGTYPVSSPIVSVHIEVDTSRCDGFGFCEQALKAARRRLHLVGRRRAGYR